MKDTPNVDPNKSSSLGYNVRFWAGVVVGYEHQKEQLESGNSWRYKVRVLGDHSDKDQILCNVISIAKFFSKAVTRSHIFYI